MMGQTMHAILVATTIATTAVLLPFSKSLLDAEFKAWGEDKEQLLTGEELEREYEEIVAKIPPLDCNRLYEMLEDKLDANFWDRTYGTGGQIGRIRRARLLRKLIQLRRSERAITKQQAWFATRKLLGQSFFTVISLLCFPWRKARDRAAKKSIDLYCDLAYRTRALCVTDGAPKCLSRLDELL